MSNKRKEPINDDSDKLIIRPLGAGQEVGRSCIYLEFKGKKILLDFGIHPGLSGRTALPFIDNIDPEELDLLLISHFHLDHCGALPWFLNKTNFKGRCFMTHATKAIYKWLLSDCIRVSNVSAEEMLYTETELTASMPRIETINFHQEIEVNGIKFWCYHAGHVLGAAMFMIEIAGVKILYTGDFSRQEDRHLMAAEVPNLRPDVLVTEATYGVHVHEPREQRENRFTRLVHDIVTRGGRCLIPVFALGRAQELLLILDEYWSSHSELHEYPIYYASSLAKKCMAVYQTYIDAMNDKIRKQSAVSNPFKFKHIASLKTIDDFDDIGPCVVLASPGMMQSGLSRELFECWCTDKRNGVIIAGYCVEGTLAKMILSEPEEITTMSGQKLPLKCSVDYISFSAHTDCNQTTDFIRELRPPHVILVHGESTEMNRLRSHLIRKFEDDPECKLLVYTPKNTQSVELRFRGEKTAKVVGQLAAEKPAEGNILSGILVRRNFKLHMMAPEDLQNYTTLTRSTVTQHLGIPFTAAPRSLVLNLSQVAGELEQVGDKQKPGIRVFGAINIFLENKMLVLEWESSPVNDVYADAVVTVILKTESGDCPGNTDTPIQVNKKHVRECLQETLSDMYGSTMVTLSEDQQQLLVTIDDKKATIDLESFEVKCDDEEIHSTIEITVKHLSACIQPLKLTPATT
ncbi:unnamed protein product [Rotaria sp. Silwood1]|nr:unnamed protein product [Rotaria sp. Silwood1]CAF1299237.1 unnamed protein product [Rotaria sp. Silwood1]CAF3513792.1 unnamed protein product [Rotaria sp. Silwood1]